MGCGRLSPRPTAMGSSTFMASARSLGFPKMPPSAPAARKSSTRFFPWRILAESEQADDGGAEDGDLHQQPQATEGGHDIDREQEDEQDLQEERR